MYKRLYHLVAGPSLYKVHFQSAYEPTQLEATAEWALGWARTIKTTCKALAPIVLIILYRRDFFSSPEPGLRAAVYLFIFYASCFAIRAMGRATNNQYRTFLNDWQQLESGTPSPELLNKLRQYDYESWAWPIAHTWNEALSPPLKRLSLQEDYDQPTSALVRRAHELASSAAAHTIGISLMFPGTFFSGANPALIDGRRQLVEVHAGTRAMLRSRTGDNIDTVFVDRRGQRANRAPDVLIVTCEGNCGFYEVGVGLSVANLDYSLLAFNKPGFSCSTGVPWPDNIAAAADVVLQYAVHRLHYKTENIVIFAWSIGGFAATWAGMQYPQLGGLVLDATFDDVVPLARGVFPIQALQSLVTATARRHLDLPNARQLLQFDGRVLLIRRTRDEIITTRPSGTEHERLCHNRANFLLVALLRHRYPQLFTDASADDAVEQRVWEYLRLENEMQRAVMLSTIDSHAMKQLLRLAAAASTSDNGRLFPLQLPESALLSTEARARMAVHLASYYLLDVDIGHNDKLPDHVFRLPRHPWED